MKNLRTQRPYLSDEIEALSLRTFRISEINEAILNLTYKSLLPGMDVFIVLLLSWQYRIQKTVGILSISMRYL